jgi:hypothetical protein
LKRKLRCSGALLFVCCCCSVGEACSPFSRLLVFSFCSVGGKIDLSPYLSLCMCLRWVPRGRRAYGIPPSCIFLLLCIDGGCSLASLFADGIDVEASRERCPSMTVVIDSRRGCVLTVLNPFCLLFLSGSCLGSLVPYKCVFACLSVCVISLQLKITCRMRSRQHILTNCLMHATRRCTTCGSKGKERALVRLVIFRCGYVQML